MLDGRVVLSPGSISPLAPGAMAVFFYRRRKGWLQMARSRVGARLSHPTPSGRSGMVATGHLRVRFLTAAGFHTSGRKARLLLLSQVCMV